MTVRLICTPAAAIDFEFLFGLSSRSTCFGVLAWQVIFRLVMASSITGCVAEQTNRTGILGTIKHAD